MILPKILNIQLIIFLLIFLQVCPISDKQFTKYQSLYSKTQNYPSEQQLPIPNQLSIDEQQNQYIVAYQKRIYLPHLTYHLELSEKKLSDSMILSGEDLEEIFLEIMIAPQADKQTQLMRESMPVLLYILELDTNKIVQSYQIHKNRIITLQKPQPKLYKILTRLQQETDNPTYHPKKLTIETSITSSSSTNKKQKINTTWLKQYLHKIDKLYDEGSILFLDSLQNWDIITLSYKQYVEHLYKWKLYSVLELIGLVAMLVGELVYLKKLLHCDIVLI